MSLPSNQAPTPTITRPDLDRDQDVKPRALRPFKVVVLDWTTMCSMLPGATRQQVAPFRSSVG